MSDVGAGRPTHPDVALLLAVRLRSRGTADAVEATWHELGADPRTGAGPALRAAAGLGQVRARGEESRWSLTPAGEAELAAHLAHDTDAAGRAEITTAYEAFLPLNRDFLVVCAAGVDEPAAVEELTVLVAGLTPVLESLTERLARFAGYTGRFAVALEAAEADPRWIDAPGIDSVHTIWFELHEHLLATLGRDRTQER